MDTACAWQTGLSSPGIVSESRSLAWCAWVDAGAAGAPAGADRLRGVAVPGPSTATA
jgi:hypothetical protein